MKSCFYGEKGSEYSLKNNYNEALMFLPLAIQFNSTDYRLFLNRVYVYLELKEYKLTLNDCVRVFKLNNKC